ncbi:hypothetical protein D3C86_1411210 [compost metagenome]
MSLYQCVAAGFAGDDHTGQRLVVEVFENLRVVRRQGQVVGNLFALDQLGQSGRILVAVFIRQAQGRALSQRPENPGHRAVERERREHQECPQRLTIKGTARQGRGHGVGMADHHALGLAGGTGGVDDIGQIGAVALWFRPGWRGGPDFGPRHQGSCPLTA